MSRLREVRQVRAVEMEAVAGSLAHIQTPDKEVVAALLVGAAALGEVEEVQEEVVVVDLIVVIGVHQASRMQEQELGN